MKLKAAYVQLSGSVPFRHLQAQPGLAVARCLHQVLSNHALITKLAACTFLKVQTAPCCCVFRNDVHEKQNMNMFLTRNPLFYSGEETVVWMYLASRSQKGILDARLEQYN